DDRGLCEDFPILCGIGITPFFLPLICLVAPEICIAVGCALVPPLCVPPTPPIPPGPPKQPDEDGDRPHVTFVPDVRASNTPVGMPDRIGLRDPVSVNAVVVNPPTNGVPIIIDV